MIFMSRSAHVLRFLRPKVFGPLIALATLSFGAGAAEVALSHSIDEWSAQGETAEGTMSLVVVNLSAGELRNVDVRSGGLNWIRGGVLQLGRIPPDEARRVSGGVVLPRDDVESGAPLTWEVSFDDDTGHHQVLVTSMPAGQ